VPNQNIPGTRVDLSDPENIATMVEELNAEDPFSPTP
jgi:hypothetical protein